MRQFEFRKNRAQTNKVRIWFGIRKRRRPIVDRSTFERPKTTVKRERLTIVLIGGLAINTVGYYENIAVKR